MGINQEVEAGVENVGYRGVSRFRRKAGNGEGVSEDLYQSIRDQIISGEIPPTVAAIKKVARGTTQAYLVIDKLQSERVVRQAENGRYQVA